MLTVSKCRPSVLTRLESPPTTEEVARLLSVNWPRTLVSLVDRKPLFLTYPTSPEQARNTRLTSLKEPRIAVTRPVPRQVTTKDNLKNTLVTDIGSRPSVYFTVINI